MVCVCVCVCVWQVKALDEDLQDGQLLIELLNHLAAPKSIERWSKNPRGKLPSIENLGLALNFCSQQNIKLVNIGGCVRQRSL